MSKTIKIRIGKDGNTQISDVCGAPGKTCLDVTKGYEAILGMALESTREITDDDKDVDQTIDQSSG